MYVATYYYDMGFIYHIIIEKTGMVSNITMLNLMFINIITVVVTLSAGRGSPAQYYSSLSKSMNVM